MSAAARTNAAPLPARSAHAAAGDTSPVTSSRRAVRGFFASNPRSAIRFIAIAAVRAATTAIATSASRQGSSRASRETSTTAAAANGSAKSEWLSFTIRASAPTVPPAGGGAARAGEGEVMRGPPRAAARAR